MNYAHIFRMITLAVAGVLIAGCGDKFGNSPNSNLSSSAVPAAGKQLQEAPQDDPPQADSAANEPPPNQRPTISGAAPSQATVGQLWAFRPTVADPDGDKLNLTASNLPGWMNLDKSTGLLSGTPTDGDVQTWSGITLSVSDGDASANLPAFSVDVLAPNAASGSVTLSWLPPTERLDGSPVGELAGYLLVYGQTSLQYTESIAINNPGITSYMVEGLTGGDWYFAVRALDVEGLYSPISAEASTTI